MIRLMIADEQMIFREGVKRAFANVSHIQIVCEADSAKQMVENCLQFEPDVLLTDIISSLDECAQSIKRIKSGSPNLPILILTACKQSEKIFALLEAGAMGYLFKSENPQQIIRAIEAASMNKPFYCDLSSSIFEQILKQSRAPEQRIMFTARERTVITLICRQMTTGEIAAEMCLSKKTVEGYRSRIAEKIDAVNAVGIVIFAIKNGLYKI